MDEKLSEFFNTFRYLRSMQEIVEEILALDYYAHNFNQEEAIACLDFCINKYDRQIRRIGSLYKDMVVVDDATEIYNEKTKEDVSSDCEYIRDCLIIIGTVDAGIRPDIQTVIKEIN